MTKVAPDRFEILERVEPTSTEPGGELYALLQKESRTFGIGGVAGPLCTPGYSDNRMTRAAGIPTFGFFPLLPEEIVRQHGPNERITVRSLVQAIRVLYDVVRGFSAGRGG